ncbi:phage tail-collar fiber domain-containing protein [Pseudomonas soli]|uniref:phage tail-collar fiber domain-containing protein n=1 Tax=Pseudomonas soli TaxID=1306993 RepID=UPI0028A93828|nr:phage tail protein [Pseudomonas soli]
MARITLAGESLIAQKQGTKEVLHIARFIYANVPGLDPKAPIDRAAPKPPASQIVHLYDIPPENSGYVNPNQVVYSSMMGSDIGDFDWNWLGLESAEGVLFAVAYLPLQQKRRNIPPVQIGNNVTRNVMVEYSGAQELTGITIDASTWQHDFTVRLQGIDERERLSNRDVYGRACFFGDALQFQKVDGTYQLAAGVAYLEGMRLALPKPVQLIAPPGATQVWIHATLRRELNDVVASWEVVYLPDQQDHLTRDGWVYCIQLADISSSGAITDRRTSEPIDGPLVKHFASRKSVADLEDGTTSAGKARQLATAREIKIAGAAEGTASFDGSKDITIALVMADNGVIPETYTKVQVNRKGMVEWGGSLLAGDIPSLDWSKIGSGKPTTLDGYGIQDALRAGQTAQRPIFYSSSPGPTWESSALEIREAKLAADSTGDWNHAPRISMHWGAVIAGDIAMNSQGVLCWNGQPLYHMGNLKPETILPAGTLIQSFSPSPPPNCLRCNGAAVSRTAYPALFASIGEYYGIGDGSTTFTLPDTRGLFVRDVDNGRGLDANRSMGTFQDGQNKAHTHYAVTGSAGWHAHAGSSTSVAGSHTHAFNYVNTPTSADNPGVGAAMHHAGVNWVANNRIQAAGDHSHTLNIVGDGAHAHTVTVDPSGGNEARPVNIALYFYIKY